MNAPTTGPRDEDLFKRWITAVGRSIVSTVVIVFVAVAFFVVRNGLHRLDDIKLILSQNLALFGAIFASLVLWNFGFGRKRAD